MPVSGGEWSACPGRGLGEDGGGRRVFPCCSFADCVAGFSGVKGGRIRRRRRRRRAVDVLLRDVEGCRGEVVVLGMVVVL